MNQPIEKHTPMMQGRDFPYDYYRGIRATYTATYTGRVSAIDKNGQLEGERGCSRLLH